MRFLGIGPDPRKPAQRPVAGPANPFHIRSHAEDGQGAAIRSLMPLGYLVSTLQLHPQRKEVIFHQGKSVENVDEPRVCRANLAPEVRGDVDKLMDYWDQWGWHRVTAYGDLKEPIRRVVQSVLGSKANTPT